MYTELNNKAEQLATLMLANGQTLAVAESCTGGWIAQVITEIPGSSVWFDRGFVTYSNAAKMQMLAVKADTLQCYGAVSEETVQEMLQGVLTHSLADCAIAVSGIAGPGGGSEDKPVGTVYIGWLKKGQPVRVDVFLFQGDRHQVRLQSVQRALEIAMQVFV